MPDQAIPTRREHDSLGDVQVPAAALYGAQTQRAVDNFQISDLRFDRRFLRALGLIKLAAAGVNKDLDKLPEDLAHAIEQAAREVADGVHDAHFPLDIFQTGSATSTNMNANEVIANRANQLLGHALSGDQDAGDAPVVAQSTGEARGVAQSTGEAPGVAQTLGHPSSVAKSAGHGPVHPNDHVNMGQSSNDVIPTAIHVAAYLAIAEDLLPALEHLAGTIRTRAGQEADTVTTGRTHLMDAMPLTLGQEFGGWAAQVEVAHDRLRGLLPELAHLAIGGTAVGTGVNAPKGFGKAVAARLSALTGQVFEEATDHFMAQASNDTAVAASGLLKATAVSMMKIANDLRWMNSGPQAGLGELALPALQPGSSIMPGKINPVIPEAVTMVCAQVIGNDSAITIAGQAANFQLSVMLPVIAHNLLQSVALLSGAARTLADKAIAGMTIRHDRIGALLGRNPILVTALNPVIGYDLAAQIAKRAYAEDRLVKEVAREMTDLSDEELEVLLDPRSMT